jgi:hypothetical protein
LPAGFDPQRFPQQSFEGGGMARRRPQLEFGVAGHPHLQQGIVAPIVQLDVREALSVAAVQTLGQPQNGRKRSHDASPFARQLAVFLVTDLRRRAAMVPGYERNCIDFLRFEPPQIPILDQVIGVFVMALVADVYADIVQQGRVFQPFALAVGQPVHGPCLVEDGERQA